MAPRPAPRSTQDLRTGGLQSAFEVGQRELEALLQRHLGLPPELGARPRDVGLADLRVVDGERLLDDPAPRLRELLHLLREGQDRELARVADVDGVVLARLREA